MNNETRKLKNMIESGGMEMTKEDIERLLDEELQKEHQYMDTALIDRCTVALLEMEDSQSKHEKRGHVFTFKKLLLIAATIAIICSISAYAFAKPVKYDPNTKGLTYEDGHFVVELEYGEEVIPQKSSSKVITTLESMGFENILLPKELLTDDWEVVSSEKLSDSEKDLSGNIVIRNTNKNICGKVGICLLKCSHSNLSAYKTINTSALFSKVELMMIGKTNVYVFGGSKTNMIIYTNGCVQYSINLDDTSFNFAKSVAKTID